MPLKARCYVASSLGFSEPGRLYSEQVLLPALRPHVEVIDPWSLFGPADLTRLDFDEERHVSEVGRRNAEAIASCELLIALLDGQELDSGTAAEIGYASALGLTCFGLRTDFRQIGEPGATVNLQVEAFIELSGGLIVGDLQTMLKALSTTIERLRPHSPEAVNTP